MMAGAATPAPARRWAWIGGLGGAALVLGLGLPARWLAQPLRHLTRDHVQLVNADGTVWHGHGDLVFSGGPDSRTRTALPGGVRWRLRPGGAGLLTLELQAPCCTIEPLRFGLALGWQRGELRWAPARLRWPPELLQGLGAPWNTLRLQGRFELETDGGRVAWAQGRWHLDGAARVHLHDLSSRMASIRPLGSYRIELQAAQAPAPPRVELVTLRGDLHLEGQGQWAGGRLRFRGVATAAPGREAALANLLNIIGRRQGERSLILLG
jgi:general secretion pathway protein N